MKKRSYFKTLLSAVITILLSICVITGSTFALFTSNDKVNIAVTGGKVQVTAEINRDSLRAYSKNVEQTLTDDTGAKVFENGGTVSFDAEDKLVLDRITPGDKATFTIDVVNDSNVDVIYRVNWTVSGNLLGALVATADGQTIVNNTTEWTEWDNAEGSEKNIAISIELPLDTDKEYQEKTAVIAYSIEFVQANADMPDEWDGTADVAWYTNNPDASEYTLSTAEQLAGLVKLLNETAPVAVAAEGDSEEFVSVFKTKTIKLDKDFDLKILKDNGEPVSFAPIGEKQPFDGTFDGQGHTISNLYQSGWDFGYDWYNYGSVGLFSEVKDATIKNVTIKNATVQIEGGDVGGITGSATGNCTFENITIADSDFGTYNNGIGGIIGWSGEGSYTFNNINIQSDVTLGGLWGSFDSSIGGVVGQGEPGATYDFNDVNVACRLDTYNDVTASYQYYLYRMTGMIIGRLAKTTTIDGANYPDMSQYNITCENVTVTYGDWMNYHYCYGFNGARYTRVESGFTYGGLDVNADDHADKCTDHLLYLPFDGLFGGDQYGVRPIKEYMGVTVVYPDSYQPENN